MSQCNDDFGVNAVVTVTSVTMRDGSLPPAAKRFAALYLPYYRTETLDLFALFRVPTSLATLPTSENTCHRPPLDVLSPINYCLSWLNSLPSTIIITYLPIPTMINVTAKTTQSFNACRGRETLFFHSVFLFFKRMRHVHVSIDSISSGDTFRKGLRMDFDQLNANFR